MFDKHTITNLLLLLIAGSLLLTGEKGRLAQLSPLAAATSGGVTTANTSVLPTGEDETSEVSGEENTEPNLFSFAERLLVYVLLMWALALGVEAGVELVLWGLNLWRPEEPGPTKVLKALNP